MQQPAKSGVPPRSASATYGFIGVGAITTAIVEGLHVGAPPTVFLSPRNQQVAQELADRFPGVHVCGSNQEVLECATSIVVAVRPPIARAVLTELSFRPQHVVMSAMAGIPLDRLRAWSAPAREVVRSIPLPSASRARSLTAMYPENATARELFTRVGDVLVPSEEPALDAFSAATSTFAAHLDYLTTIATWLTDHGVDHSAATTYTTHIFGQLGQSLLQPTDSLPTLTEKHMTPGGINLQLLTDLRHDGVPDTVRRALDRVLSRLRD
ncbi:NAD(P)-binding domain-containing protein [Nocardia sp. NPDC049149]|uniref:NAD(P)-binding domain-containing protein n=1 Tax=Nocardia sp. NPDC049149 TaxID=3364315 RepID=UPI00371BCDC0